MRMTSIMAAVAATLLTATPVLAQDVAITGAKVLTGTSVIENGTVVIRNGRVVSVGTAVAPAGIRTIDARGKIVSPGIVAVDSGLATSEVSSVRGTNDLSNSANSLTAAFDVSYGIDPWSFTLPTARLGGVTRAVASSCCSRKPSTKCAPISATRRPMTVVTCAPCHCRVLTSRP